MTALHDHTALVAATDDHAGSAARASVAATALHGSLDRLRHAGPGAPVPAPGLDDHLEAVFSFADEVFGAAVELRNLVTDPGDPADPDGPASDALVRIATHAHDSRLQAAAALRHLAQIGLGVLHLADPPSASERAGRDALERTLIEVLTDDEDGAPWVVDAHGLTGTTREELAVTLAGVVARLLADAREGDAEGDHDPRFGPATAVLTAPGLPDLGVATDGTTARVSGLGTFTDPVSVRDVTEALLGIALDVHGAAPATLQIAPIPHAWDWPA